MTVTHYDDAANAPIEELIALFVTIDRDAAGRTYDTSTASMSRAMFFDSPSSVSDEQALRAFYDEFADEVVVYRDVAGDAVGFTMFRSDDPMFLSELPSYTPHIAITYSGVHPAHQRNGIWTQLRDVVQSVAETRDSQYILTGVDYGNEVSLSANKERGFEQVGQIGDVGGTGRTMLLARQLSDGLQEE